MKKSFLSLRIIIILLSVVCLSSCDDIIDGIDGKGPVVSMEIETAIVEGVSLGLPATLYITQGDVQKITIIAQENIQNNIESYNSNGILNLKFRHTVFSYEPIEIYMTVQSLKEATITGSGSIISQSIFETDEQLSLEISGSGDIDLNAYAESVKILISGSGDLNLITTTNQIEAEINGSGDINLKGGYAELSNFYINGSGNVNAYPFNSESCYIETMGSGNARLNISEVLDVKISGSGDVFYKGNPVVSANRTGSGRIINAN